MTDHDRRCVTKREGRRVANEAARCMTDDETCRLKALCAVPEESQRNHNNSNSDDPHWRYFGADCNSAVDTWYNVWPHYIIINICCARYWKTSDITCWAYLQCAIRPYTHTRESAHSHTRVHTRATDMLPSEDTWRHTFQSVGQIKTLIKTSYLLYYSPSDLYNPHTWSYSNGL